jgi:hypothetical protein
MGNRNHFELPVRRRIFLMPRANTARGKVLGALPRTPARGTPPETPAPFPFCSTFQNGPRRPGSAQENLFKSGKHFPPPRKHRAPWTAPGRSEDSLGEGKGGNGKDQTLSVFAVASGLPPVASELFNRFAVGKHHTSILGTFLTS